VELDFNGVGRRYGSAFRTLILRDLDETTEPTRRVDSDTHRVPAKDHALERKITHLERSKIVRPPAGNPASSSSVTTHASFVRGTAIA
jgi:hypothetical protein